jgi:hypothetical protein
MIKNNCYSCKFRGTIPGDTHSCCQHPDLEGVTDNPIEGVFAMFASVGRVSPRIAVQATAEKFEIKANYHGIKQGWFNWPWNFDPVWLENCNAYEKKGQANGEKKDDRT